MSSGLRRDSRVWRTLAAQVRARDKAAGTPCRICGQPIKWDAHDHIRSWRDHPDLRLDPTNLATVHQACNRAKGARPQALPSIGNQSRQWGRPRT